MTNLEAVQVAEMEWGEAVEPFFYSAKMSQLSVAFTAEIELIVKELGFLALAINWLGHTYR